MSKNYSLSTLVLLVIGNMIGAGVFTTSGLALAELKFNSYVMLAWMIGGLIAICGALSYGLLAQEISESGGEYVFLHRKFHPLAGCIAGFISIMSAFSGAVAFSGLALETFLSSSIPALNILPVGMVASLVVLGCISLHYFTHSSGIIFQNITVALKIISLILFIAIAFIVYKPTLSVSAIQNTVPFSLSAFSTVVMWVFYSYSGFNASVYIFEQAKNPYQDIPRSMIMGTLIVTVIYIILNAIFLFIPPVDYIVGQVDIATRAAFIMGGDLFSAFVTWSIIIALLSSISTMIHIGPHIIAKMADDGFLPHVFSSKDKKIPVSTVLLQLVIILVLIWSSELKELVSYLGITLFISSGLTVATLFKPSSLHSRPWYLMLAPVLFILSTIVFSFMTMISNPHATFVTALTIMAGASTYIIAQLKRDK